MTENCCVCSYLDTKKTDGVGSVGVPWDAVEVKIDDLQYGTKSILIKGILQK